MSSRNDRIMEEFNKLKNSQCISIVKCEFMNGDINNWRVCFEGSPCSPYEDGIFQVKVHLPKDFPKGRRPHFLRRIQEEQHEKDSCSRARPVHDLRAGRLRRRRHQRRTRGVRPVQARRPRHPDRGL